MLGANALGWAFLGQGYAGPTSVPPPPPIVGVKSYASASDSLGYIASASDGITSGAKASNA